MGEYDKMIKELTDSLESQRLAAYGNFNSHKDAPFSSALNDWLTVRDALFNAQTDIETYRSITLKALKDECIKKNIRQAEIARQLNVSRGYVSDIWRGRRELTMSIAKRIADLI